MIAKGAVTEIILVLYCGYVDIRIIIVLNAVSKMNERLLPKYDVKLNIPAIIGNKFNLSKIVYIMI